MNLATTDVFKTLANTTKNKSLIELTDEQVKQVQTKILEMANDVISICEENNFEYNLGGGSALGAVRHKGFIPWDDDIDIDISRKDYRKLLNLIKEKYPNKYDIHEPYNKNGFSSITTNIRLKGTIVRGCNDYTKEECGLSLDLVVVENTFNNGLLRKLHGFGSLAFGLICSCRKFAKYSSHYLDLAKGNEEATKIFKTKIFIGRLFGLITLRRWNIMADSWNRMCHNFDSKYVVVPTGRKHFFGELYERSDFLDYKYEQFETFSWRVPKAIDKYLSHMYGDYMWIPPKEKQETHVLLEFEL